MKACIFLAIMIATVSVNAQSLKETLYGGKLKTDTGTVIRKGEDLSTKIDTTTRKPVIVETKKTETGATVNNTTPGTNSAVTGTTTTQNDPATAAPASATKDNNKAWKDFIDELTGTLRTEVLPNKKIKSGTYSILLEYEIGVDGQVTANNVSCSPESSFLEQQIKERITLTAPQLTPLLGTNGKPRKAVKKQTIVLSKG